MPGTRRFFLIGLIFALLLAVVIPTFSGSLMPRSIPNDAAQGFRVWQAQDCAGCHTLDRRGGVYASDLTHVYSLRGENTLREFLRHLATSDSAVPRIMPFINLSDADMNDLLAFLQWIDANAGTFPPQPFPIKPTP